MRKKYRKYIALSLLVLLFCTFSASAAEMDQSFKSGGDPQSEQTITSHAINKNKTFGLSSQTGEYEVLTDSNFWGDNTVNVSMISTQGPNPVKVRIYTKNSSGTYTLKGSADVTFEKPFSQNVAGDAFKVTAEFVDGITGNCTLNIKSYSDK